MDMEKMNVEISEVSEIESTLTEKEMDALFDAVNELVNLDMDDEEIIACYGEIAAETGLEEEEVLNVLVQMF